MSICSTIMLAVGLYTTHIPAGDYNEDNKLVGVGCDKLSVASFDNSYNNQSWLVGYDLPIWQHRGYKIGFMPALVTGYSSDKFMIDVPDWKVLPVPVVYGQVGFLRVSSMYNAINISINLEIDL